MKGLLPMTPTCLLPQHGPSRDQARAGRATNWVGTLVLVAAATIIGPGGAASATASAVPPERISVEPATIALSGAGARQQVAVTGHYADGSVRDLTGDSRFTVVPQGLAGVTPGGVVTVATGREGHGRLVIEASGRSTEATIEATRPGERRPVSYRHDVVALLSKAGCNMGACHGNLNGKGGFRLSLRGDDPKFDLENLTRDMLGRRVDRTQPGRSLAVLKPTGQLPHEGGLRFAPGSPEAATLIGWIASGTADDVGEVPKLKRLTVFPPARIAAAPALEQQLVVTAEFADGTRRDVTRQASYDVSDPTRATVSVDGRFVASSPCETTVAVRYLGGRGISRLAFLPDRPDFVWQGPPGRNAIDAAVFAKLKAHKINPTPPVDDLAFLRRATLDALGRLPTPEEIRTFLEDGAAGRRDRLVDRLIARAEFADFWALKWADLLRNEEKTMGEKGVWVFQRWLRDELSRDTPLDEFARRLITAQGSTWENPPASFYRTNRDPMTAAETVGQVFLGVRLQCARCHNHPFDVWTQDDYYGLAAYFGNVAHKEINNVRRDMLDTHEINGDEIIFLSGQPEMVQPRSGAMMEPKAPRGPKPRLDGDIDARDDLADWLTRNNRQFARNLANRIWFHLLGRGVVDPVDDFRDSNPPSNPALLDALTDTFVAGGMRVRPLVAWIMKSQTYQLGSEPNPTNAGDEANFARAAVRLLPAEVLLDAIGQALGKPGAFPSGPAGVRAVQLPGARMGGDFLKVFGKPDRLLTCECERSESTTLAQAFQLINGEAVRRLLEADDNRIGRLLRSGTPAAAILDELSLAILGRPPTAAEQAAFLVHVGRAGAGADAGAGEPSRRKAWEDVAWALINSKEFLLRH
jgi:hypothetical protein